jgi:ribA/ribD-fused uncharacterized protein
MRKVFTELSPSSAKYLGRHVELRSDWEDVKDNIMYEIVYNKFSNNLDLRNSLHNTGDAELIEGNWWNDKYWGMSNGEGQNKLGKILMRVRDELNGK